MKTPEQLKGSICSMSAKRNLRAQEVLQMFLFERVIERLSCSSYQNNFILKGGLLISSMLGISERTTMDMDTTVHGIQMEENEIVRCIQEILAVDVDDDFVFEYEGIEPIREDDENFKYVPEKSRVTIGIDIPSVSLPVGGEQYDALTFRYSWR